MTKKFSNKFLKVKNEDDGPKDNEVAGNETTEETESVKRRVVREMELVMMNDICPNEALSILNNSKFRQTLHKILNKAKEKIKEVQIKKFLD
mmetsp:Transcript_20500/g.28833  ORF Transcript_20500/g.28833 Transcript_20500/m.28833 type:complete len:92 (+) Transcript_20500:190-465(+)